MDKRPNRSLPRQPEISGPRFHVSTYVDGPTNRKLELACALENRSKASMVAKLLSEGLERILKRGS